MTARPTIPNSLFYNPLVEGQFTVEFRQAELEARSRELPSFGDVAHLRETMSRVKVFNAVRRKKRKMRKPLRGKKLRPVIKCRECSHNLDRKGKLRHYNNSYYCRKCWHKLFYRCVRCEGVRRRSNQSQPTRVCPRCKDVLVRRSRAMSTNQVSWCKSHRAIEGSTYEIVGSKRSFGIEIETNKCPWAERLEGKTPFGCKYDATVSGREFDSPILSGDAGLTVVRHFCDLAKSRGWKVDNECGTHLHLDMRGEPDRQVKKVALAYLLTYPFWSSLVEPHRLNNQYCAGMNYTVQQLLDSDFYRLAARVGRYHFINIAAYVRHQTIEIRGLEGSLDKSLISNWIKAHLRFTDYVMTRSMSDINQQFSNQTESAMWECMKQCIGQGPTRFWGRVRANRAMKCA